MIEKNGESNDEEKRILEEGLPRFVDSPLEATALSCSKCGAPSLRGAPICPYCGSGLNSEIYFNLDKLRSIALELDWKKDLLYKEFPDAISKAREIAGQRGGKNSFFIAKGVPVFVSDKLSDEEVYKNFMRLLTLKRRDDLGDAWYGALNRFYELQKVMSRFDPEMRLKIAKKIYETGNWKRGAGYEGTFFEKLSFETMEDLMDNFVGSSDAESLNKAIERISKVIEDILKQ